MQRLAVRFDPANEKATAVPVDEEPVVPVVVAALKPECEVACLVLAKKLRQAGIGCTVDATAGKLGKKLERAGKARVYYVIILGPDEVAAGKVTLRDMDEKTNEALPEAEAITKLSEMVLTSEQRHEAARHQAVQEAFR